MKLSPNLSCAHTVNSLANSLAFPIPVLSRFGCRSTTRRHQRPDADALELIKCGVQASALVVSRLASVVPDAPVIGTAAAVAVPIAVADELDVVGHLHA